MLRQQTAEQIVFDAGAFHRVDSIELVWDHEAAVPELRLHLKLHSEQNPAESLSLDFSGVADLKLQAALSFDDRVGTILVRDIRDRGWGDINFEVFEPDDLGLYFMCSSWAKK